MLRLVGFDVRFAPLCDLCAVFAGLLGFALVVLAVVAEMVLVGLAPERTLPGGMFAFLDLDEAVLADGDDALNRLAGLLVVVELHLGGDGRGQLLVDLGVTQFLHLLEADLALVGLVVRLDVCRLPRLHVLPVRGVELLRGLVVHVLVGPVLSTLVRRERKMPAVLAQELVVRPVGEERARAVVGHGKPPHGAEGEDEDRKRQNAVRHDLVDLVRKRSRRPARRTLEDGADDALDVGVALRGDNGLRVVVHLLFAVLDVFFDVRKDVRRHAQRLNRLRVPLEHLDRRPAAGGFLDLAVQRLLDVREGVLHRTCEHVRTLALHALLRLGDGELRRLPRAFALQRRNLQHRTSQRLRELCRVDLVAVPADDVHHVHRHDHRQPQFQQLRGEVEVALQVRAVHDVQDGVRLLVDEVVARHDLLERVRRERVDAGKVLDHHVVRALQPAVLLLHRHAGPVADVLVGTRQVVEERRLAAVRVSRERDLNISHI